MGYLRTYREADTSQAPTTDLLCMCDSCACLCQREAVGWLSTSSALHTPCDLFVCFIYGSCVLSFTMSHVCTSFTLFCPVCIPIPQSPCTFCCCCNRPPQITAGDYEVQPRLRRTLPRMFQFKDDSIILSHFGGPEIQNWSEGAKKSMGQVRLVETVGICALPFATPCDSRQSLATCPMLHQPTLLFYLLPSCVFVMELHWVYPVNVN